LTLLIGFGEPIIVYVVIILAKIHVDSPITKKAKRIVHNHTNRTIETPQRSITKPISQEIEIDTKSEL
jgi:hypothetical protein